MTPTVTGNDTVSRFIESQFPDFYHESGPALVAFVKAYYEFLETHPSHSVYVNRRMFEYGDIDLTLAEFIEHFKAKYLKDFPVIGSTDHRFLIKNITDVYRAKGTPQAMRLLFQLLFGTDVDVQLPSVDVWKLSDSQWTQPFYLEMSVTSRNVKLVNKQITGASSGATAFVESVVRKRVEGKIIDVVYISHIKGNFQSGELVSENGILDDAPVVVGSLSSIDVTLGGANYKIGDVLDVYSTTGRQGRVRVSGIENATGRVNFQIIDGGYGYTATRIAGGALNEYASDVYVSTAMLYIDNPSLMFERFEKIEQKRQLVTLVSGLDISSYDWQPGDTLSGYAIINGANVKTAEAVVGQITNFNSGGDPVPTPEANCVVEVFPTLGRFDSLTSLGLTTDITDAALGDKVEEESIFDLELSGIVGTLSIGDQVIQPIFVTTGGEQVLKSISVGTISGISGGDVTLSPAFGSFVPLVQIKTVDSSASAMVDNVVQSQTGATGYVNRIVEDDFIVVSETVGDFTVGKDVVLVKDPFAAYAIASVDNASVSDVEVTADNTKVGVVAAVSDASVSGIVVGQNTVAVGVSGNTAAFSAIASTPVQLLLEDAVEWAKVGGVGLSKTLEGDYIITSVNTNADRFIWQPVSVNGSESYKLSFIVMSPSSIASKMVVALSHAGGGNDTLLIDLSNDSFTALASSAINDIVINRVPGSIWLEVTIYFVPANTGLSTVRFAIDYAGATASPATSSIVVSRLVLNSELNTRRSWITTMNRPDTQVQGFINRIGSGQGATFEIGTIENEESITVNTDIIGDINSTGNVPFLQIGVGGWNSGIGFVESFDVIDGGSGYSNGSTVYTTLSGINVPATGTIVTDGSGAITAINVVDNGSGFNGPVSVVLPPTSGTQASISADISFGYGFPTNPTLGFNDIIGHALSLDTMTIGTIAALSRINPGANYNAAPFVAVRNKWVAGFERRDFILTLSNMIGVFRNDEILSQTVSDPENPGSFVVARGIVKEHIGDTMYVKRASFGVSLQVGSTVTGFESGASATVIAINSDTETEVMGNNAIIDSKVQTANGTVTAVEVLNSGYGYEEGAEVGLKNLSNITIVEGVARLGKQGRGEGFWETTTSHVSHDKVLQDSYFYQDFSYQVVSEFSLNRYADLLEKVAHVAGHKLFGSVVINRSVDLGVEPVESVVESYDMEIEDLFFDNDNVFIFGEPTL